MLIAVSRQCSSGAAAKRPRRKAVAEKLRSADCGKIRRPLARARDVALQPLLGASGSQQARGGRLRPRVLCAGPRVKNPRQSSLSRPALSSAPRCSTAERPLLQATRTRRRCLRTATVARSATRPAPPRPSSSYRSSRAPSGLRCAPARFAARGARVAAAAPQPCRVARVSPFLTPPRHADNAARPRPRGYLLRGVQSHGVVGGADRADVRARARGRSRGCGRQGAPAEGEARRGPRGLQEGTALRC